MFMNTIAVGPFEPTEFCVTGGATVAIDDRNSWGRALWHMAVLENDSADCLQGKDVETLRIAMKDMITRQDG